MASRTQQKLCTDTRTYFFLYGQLLAKAAVWSIETPNSLLGWTCDGGNFSFRPSQWGQLLNRINCTTVFICAVHFTKLNKQMKTIVLCEYLDYAINQNIFFTYELFWFGIPESYVIKQFMPLTRVICIRMNISWSSILGCVLVFELNWEQLWLYISESSWTGIALYF